MAEKLTPEQKLARLNAILDFWKFLLGSVVVVVFSALLSHYLQTRELKLKELAQDSASYIAENENLGKFLETAMKTDFKEQLRFANYFSHLTRDPQARIRWEGYAKYIVDTENERVALAEKGKKLEEVRTLLASKERPTADDAKSLKKIESDIASVQQELTVKQALLSAVPDKPSELQNMQAFSNRVLVLSQPEITQLIAQLTESNTTLRRSARTKLAAAGQAVLKPLIAELIQRQSSNNENDYRMRLGVATALRKMTQPVFLDAEDAKLIVGLLYSNDAETRVTTTEFLMDLEARDSIHHVYQELARVLEAEPIWNVTPPAAGASSEAKEAFARKATAAYNAALVVSTWSRNLHATILSPDGSRPMRDFAKAKGLEWLNAFQNSSHRGEWGQTIQQLSSVARRG